MKTIFIFCLILCSLSCSAQDLNGSWFGYFTSGPRGEYKVPIGLEISRNPDSTYNMRSYTKYVTVSGKDSIIVCEVNFKKTKTHILLEETNLTPADSFGELQKMYLKFRKKGKNVTLIGWWVQVNDKLRRGNIYFDKLN